MSKKRDRGGKREASPPSPSSPKAAQPEPQIVDSPQQWYYNDDITDPVNFGFMFPVPKGGRRKTSDPPSNLPVSSAVGPPLPGYSASSTSASPSKQPVSPPFIPRQVPEAAKFVSHPPGIYNSSSQYPIIAQPSLASLAASHRDLAHQNLPYRYSPHQGTSLNTSSAPQQYVTTLINERLPFYGPPTSQVLQSGTLHSSANIQSYTNHDFVYNTSSDHAPYAAPILSQEPAGPPLSLKRKGAASSPSPVLQPPTSDRFHSGNSAMIFAKRRRPVNPLSQQHTYYAIDSALCVRCQIYSKAYTSGGLCESCIQATNFTAWPSLRGTRRENMETLVLYLLPAHMEDCIRQMPSNVPKSRTWRLLSTPPPEQEYDFSALVFQDQCVLVKEQVRSTGLFSEDFVDLADIAQKYQRSLRTPNPTLEACCTLLSACCELYKSVVTVARSKSPPKAIDIQATIENIQNTRTLMFRGFRELQEMALAPSDTRDRETWLPSFLCACWMGVSAVIFLDILIAFPSPWKEQIWGQGWHNRISELRHGGYGMLVHLLQANTMGVNPLKLEIWADDIVPAPVAGPSHRSTADLLTMSTGYAQSMPKNLSQTKGYMDWPLPSENPWMGSHTIGSRAERDREVLLGAHSPAALQGLTSLKAWQKRHDNHLKMGEDMFSKDLYSLALMKPIAGLWRVFEMK